MTSAASGVLVTGSHRSGSTWVGRLLAAADELHYVHEPFSIVARVPWMATPPRQFLYLTEETAGRWHAELSRMVALRPPALHRSIAVVRAGRGRALMRQARDAAEARRAKRRPLVKDPIALFSAPYLVEQFGLAPVVLIRDPLAFVGSLKERGWFFDFGHWAEQPLLLRDLLPHLAAEIRAAAAEPGDIVAQGVLQWNAFYSVVHRYRLEHPDWEILRYETLAADPDAEIPALYERLGLRFGAAQRAVLEDLTTGGSGRNAVDVRRDSTAALDTWRSRLDRNEIERITTGTAEVAADLGLR